MLGIYGNGSILSNVAVELKRCLKIVKQVVIISEKSHPNNQRLSSLILLIALAYSCALVQGQKIKAMGVQKYVGRLTECGRSIRRHSSFWIGLYGQCWVVGMEFCQDIIRELMRIRRNKLPSFQRGMRAMSLILSMF
jgi:hypothetical protein